jgi:multiple sugar transport system permease protein/putative chitobiose transport system permease protein
VVRNDLTRPAKVVVYGVLIVLSVVVILPYLWVIGSSLTMGQLIGRFSGLSLRTFIPERVTLENYAALFTKVNMLRVLFNTVFVAVVVSLAGLVVNSMAAFALARLGVRGKNVIFAVIISTMFIPFELMIIPLFQVVRDLGIMDSYAALIVPAIASGFGIFFFRQFFLDVPQSLEEAAFIDGAGMFRTYWQILLPLLKVPMITMGIMTFIMQWDNFLWAITVINKEELTVLQVALTFIATATTYVSDLGVIFSGVVLAAIPMLILYLFLQKYITQGIATVGIKG